MVKKGLFQDFVSRNFFYPNISELSHHRSDEPKRFAYLRRVAELKKICFPKVMDVTRFAHAPMTSGIPRVVRQLVMQAQSQGVVLAIWHGARLVPVSCDPNGKITFPSEFWKRPPKPFSPQKYFVRLMSSPFWFAALGMVFRFWPLRTAGKILLAFARRLTSGVPRTFISTEGLQYFLPEIPAADTTERLFVALQNEPDMKINVLVHDLLPLSNPYHFDRESTVEFLSYLQLVSKAKNLVVGSPVLGDQLELFLSALGVGDGSKVSVRDLPIGRFEFDEAKRQKPQVRERSALFIGGFQSRKGLPVAAELFSREPVGKLVLNVVGIPNPTDALQVKLFRQIREFSNVNLVGNLSDEDLSAHISEASVVMYLSGAEGYGLPVIEGLAAGKPVVCLDTPINNYFQRKYGGLFLVPHIDGQYSEVNLFDALIRSQSERFVRPKNLPQDGISWAQEVFKDVFSDEQDT